MAPEFRFFQIRVPSGALCSAVFAIGFVVIGLPAHAETLELFCDFDNGGSATFLVDFDRKTVQSGSSTSCTWIIDGKQIDVPDCNPPGRAEITDRQISWKTTGKNMDGAGGLHNKQVEGSIDRQAGSVRYAERPDNSSSWSLYGKCRRATQKF